MNQTIFRFLPATILIFLMSSLGYSQNAGSVKELKEIFAKAKAAVGTKQQLANVKSIYAQAECLGPEGKYTTKVFSAFADRVYFEQEFSYRDKPSKLTVVKDIGWDTSDESTTPSLLSPFHKLVIRLHEYQRLAFDFETDFGDFELDGEETLNNVRHHKIKAETRIGVPAELFFDKGTGRFSGYRLPGKGTDEAVTNLFKKWQVIDGLNLPVLVEAVDSKGTWLLDFEDVTINEPTGDRFVVPQIVKDIAELLRLQKQAETAHKTYNAELFVSAFDNDLTQIQSGEVLVRDKASNLTRFKKYFSSYKFKEWDDIVPPIVRISKDGTLATIQVQKRVSGSYKDDKGKEHNDLTVFAWLEVWEKTDGVWKVVQVASTTKPND